MSKKLFVGSLAWGTDDVGLRAAFESYGEIQEAVVINDRDTGRSRGFGFVTFADDAAADKAIEGMHGAELDGRTLEVNEARERAPRSGGGGGNGGGGYRGGGGGSGGGGGGYNSGGGGGGGGRDKGKGRGSGKGSRRGSRDKDRDRW
jgi:RNA recognition motif-containing protein